MGRFFGEVFREIGISEQTFYRWKKRFRIVMPSAVRHLMQVDEEHGRPPRLVAVLSLAPGMRPEAIKEKP